MYVKIVYSVYQNERRCGLYIDLLMTVRYSHDAWEGHVCSVNSHEAWKGHVCSANNQNFERTVMKLGRVMSVLRLLDISTIK